MIALAMLPGMLAVASSTWSRVTSSPASLVAGPCGSLAWVLLDFTGAIVPRYRNRHRRLRGADPPARVVRQRHRGYRAVERDRAPCAEGSRDARRLVPLRRRGADHRLRPRSGPVPRDPRPSAQAQQRPAPSRREVPGRALSDASSSVPGRKTGTATNNALALEVPPPADLLHGVRLRPAAGRGAPAPPPDRHHRFGLPHVTRRMPRGVASAREALRRSRSDRPDATLSSSSLRKPRV